MKAQELTVLDHEELSDRLRTSRRELYELRFKLAVGQLENNREIRKVRKDIARILTVLHRQEMAGALSTAAPETAPETAPKEAPS